MARRPQRSSYDRSAYSTKRSQRRAQRAGGRHRKGADPALDARNAALDSLFEDDGASSSRGEAGAAAFSRSSYGSENPYSRTSGTGSYSDIRRKRHRRSLVKRALVAVLVTVLLGAGGAFGYLWYIQNNMNDGMDPELMAALARANAGDPFYMVLMGTDASTERMTGDEFAGDNFRTDSLMLARIDPRDQKVAVVSLMRDTQVDMGDEYGLQKINAAHAIGGPAFTVQTVSKLADVPVSHYAEINFDGFCEVVDALGGIDVDVPIEIDDPDAGGHLDAGPQTLNGNQALILCRSRSAFEEYGSGDSYRAANQRMVIGAILSKLLHSDLGTMMGSVQALSSYVTTDFSLSDILSLAGAMHGIDMESSFYTAVNPTTSKYIDGVWWEIMDAVAWRQMMDRIDQGLPPSATDDIDPATGIAFSSAGSAGSRAGAVAVRNGSGIDGAGTQAQQLVEALGYSTTVANANHSDYRETLVVYSEAGQRPYAEEIVEKLGCGRAEQDDGDYIFTGNFLVLIGSDWPGAKG
ncbi:MAG: LCP family protein [Eggerthellaceae bacterium]|jgi:LCP family protein required for cell wall assembly|nr:LCP family protein [Eggerthellaceae bacterium]